MIKRTRNIAFLFFLALFTITYAYAQLQNENSTGGQAGSPMRIGFGARGISMGNALTAVIEGELQSYYNPAVVPFASMPTITAAYGLLSLDRHLNFLSYTNHIRPNAGFSVAIINSGVGNIDGRDYDGNHTDTYSTSENSFNLAFGLKPAEEFSFGVSVKVFYYSLFEKVKSTTAGVDIGGIWIISDRLNAGFVVQDIGSKYKWNTSDLYGLSGNTTTDRFPLRKRLGLSWNPDKYPILLSGEFESIGTATYLRFGSEIEVYEGVYLRGGCDRIALNIDEPAEPALGLSVQKELNGWTAVFQYAYAFEPYSPSGIHILSLAVRLK